MTCEAATTLLHLNRPGERTEAEEHQLEAHLRTCNTCTEEARIIRSTMKSMDLFTSAPAPVVDAATETRHIMEAIRQASEPAPGLFDLILRISHRPGPRIAYGLFSLAVIAMMLLQLASVGADDSRFGLRTGPYISFAIDTRQLDEITSLPLPENIKTRVLTAPTIDVRKTDLGRSSKIGSQTMLRYLSLTEEQRSRAAMTIAALQKTSVLSIRLGKIGG